MSLRDEAALDRWSRQLRFDGIGEAGQRKIARATVLVVGCGALGSAAAEMLARSGVGRLRIVDRDVVELTNLQRQSLFSERDAAEQIPKAEAAARRLAEIDSALVVEPIVREFSARSAEGILDGVDLAVDGTDNFPVRFVLNDAAFRAGIPWVYGATVGATGVVGVFVPPGPCLRCFLEEPPPAGSLPTCETAGIVPSLPPLVAALEVGEALKLLVGTGERLTGLLTLDLWNRVDIRRLFTGSAPRPGCPTCGERLYPSLTGKEEVETAVLCGRDAVQISPREERPVDLERLAATLARLGPVRRAGSALAFEAEGVSFTIFADGRCLVRGVADPLRARALHARYVGS